MSNNDGVNTGGNTDRRLQNLRPAWKPGESGNPLGQSIALSHQIALECRRGTRNGRDLVEFHLRIVHGEVIHLAGRARGQVPTLDQRLEAARWLADRGWGRAKEVVELVGEASPAQRLELLRRLSDEDRNQLKVILTRALHGASAPGSHALDAPAGSSSAASFEDAPSDHEEAPADRPPPDPTNREPTRSA